MMRMSYSTAIALAFALAAPAGAALQRSQAAADDAGTFIVRLGQDTTAVERYTRSADKMEIDQVGRAPRVLQRHYVYTYAKGALQSFSMVVTPPGATAPTQTVQVAMDGDSLRVTTQSGTAPATRQAMAFPAGAPVVAGSAPWSGYEPVIMQLAKSRRDSLRTPMLYLGMGNTIWLSLHKIGRDSVSILNERGDQYHARIDKAGHILGVLPIAGTAKIGAERVPSADLAALTASFAAREQSGAGMGVLSPRDSVKTTVGGASLYVDYGRPGKRGRVIFGTIVPYGEVWRTGANAATQFRTDKALDFGGVVVPPGFYTLWTVPGPDGWKLLVNGETGQWGTEHKADKDLYTIPMTVSALPDVAERFTIAIEPSGEGGVIRMDWDKTRASATFAVKP